MRSRILAAAAVVVSLVGASPVGRAQQATTEQWVGTWATAPVSSPAQPPAQAAPNQPNPPAFNNQTLRQIVRVSIGGSRVRVIFTNAFGSKALAIGGAQVALRDKGAATAAGSERPLTFSGVKTVTIPPGALIVSDPVDLRVARQADLAIDVYLPGDTVAAGSPLTIHSAARQTSYASSTGNHVGARDLPGAAPTTSWAFLSRVDVLAPAGTGAVAAFGDSITDGFNSTVDTNNRWPDHLAARLAAAGVTMGVLNLGIDGNRVLADGAGVSALARFDRDVLAQAGVTHVFVLEGINDLGLPNLFKDGPRPTAAQLIAGHRQLIARAHARGLKIFASTLLPYEGTTFPGYFTPEGEAIRQEFNTWMRTAREYDGVVDFDALMRDPAQPSRMLPKFDSGDHLHPNDAGYKTMADAVDLAFFGARAAKAAAH
ncbi:MAG: SGNH/GDSL hydrolase family protein [Vicinamibacterales bacterium]